MQNSILEKIYKGDCLEYMEYMYEIKGSFVDFIFVDPPYFLSNDGITCVNGRMVKVNKGEWDKSKGYENDIKFHKEWLKRCKKLLKFDGTIAVSTTHHSLFDLGTLLRGLEFKFLNNITWEKPNPPPNLSCRYLTHSTENILWFANNSKSKWKFNYEYMKPFNNGKQLKDVWTILPPRKYEKKFGKHPTQKPLELIDRLILSATDEGDIVLDPFMGSGSTAVSAISLKRIFYGIEIDKNYIKLAKKRIREVIKQSF